MQSTKLQDPIEEYLRQESWLIKENANQTRSYAQMKGFVSTKAIKEYTLQRYPEDIRRFHREGYFHIHDLANGITGYCCGLDFLHLLTEGLWTPHVVSNPPRHLNSALNQAVNYLCASQQEWAGAQALGDFNTLLAPFVARDGLSYDEVRQAIQEFIWDMNYPTRGGGECPFTNVMFNTKCPENLSELPVPEQLGFSGDTFSDFHDESIMVLRAFNDVFSGGDRYGTPFTFPIPTINLIESTDFDEPVWDEVMATEAKYGSYFWMNYIGSGIKSGSKRAMCCRLMLDLEDLPPAGGRWAFESSTGSLGVVSLNLPKLGYICRDEDELLATIASFLEHIKESLLLKNGWVQDMYDLGYLPVTKHYGANFDRYFRTVGIIGLNEMVLNHTGSPIWKNPDLAYKVLRFIRDWTREAQLSTGKLWNLELTPGEGSATSLAFKDLRRHPNIVTQGTPDAPYYTTMITPPSVWMSLNERISVEEPLLNLFTGGTVHRIYMGEDSPSPSGMKKVVTRIAHHSRIPYYDVSATFSICSKCASHMRGHHEVCDKCGGRNNVYSRIVGYYRSIDSANVGKAREIRDRKYVNLSSYSTGNT